MTDKRPQTIQFFLPQGEPRGIRIAEITTRIVQAVLVPRSKLAEAANRDELKSVGVYFLFGEPEDAAKPVVYIGETEDCYDRFVQHNRTLDFWQAAVAIVSKTNSFTKAHAKYLEWHCIKVAKEVGRFHLSNGNAGGQPFVTEPMLADLMDSFDTLNVLTSALGFPLFEARPAASSADVFELFGPDCKGRGQLVEDGFTVFAGSKAQAGGPLRGKVARRRTAGTADQRCDRRGRQPTHLQGRPHVQDAQRRGHGPPGPHGQRLERVEEQVGRNPR